MEKKRDLRIEKTYMALTNAFIDLLKEKKFEEITINCLCERAMVRRATFYKHFADKYDFFNFFIQEMQEKFEKENEALWRETNSVIYCQNCARSLVHFLNENEQMVRSCLDSSVLPTLLSMISDRVTTTVTARIKADKERGFKLDVDPETLASFYAGGFIQTVRIWILQKDRIPEEEFLQKIDGIYKYFLPEQSSASRPE